MDYQWYPGHMTRARRQMEEDIRLIDLVIELTDARAPLSSRNPDIDAIARGKGRILVMNKADLADPELSRAWSAYFETQYGLKSALINSREKNGVRVIRPLIDEAVREKTERDRKRGIVNRPVRMMIVGIPNVGKSTFINSFAGKSAAKTGNKPGVTKGKQWIAAGKNLQLLDTPGILWPKFDDQQVGMRLAMLGGIRDEILQSAELALALIDCLRQEYPGVILRRYQVPEEGSGAEILEKIAVARNCLKPGPEPDYDKASSLVLDDLRSGRLGRITLERPEGGSSAWQEEGEEKSVPGGSS